MKDTNEKTEPLFFTDTNCKLLFDNMQSGVAYHEMIFENGKPVDFIFIAVNKAFEETIGLTNVEGKKGSELVPRIQESDPELFDICGRVAESGKPERIEYHIKALNRWYTSSLYSPKKGYFVSISEDITERKQAEKFVRKMQRQQKSILDNIPDIAWLKDNESRFIAVNSSFGRACGYNPNDLTGKTDLDIWPCDLAERYRADDREVMQSGKRKRVIEPLSDKEDGMQWIETIKTPVLDETGQVIGTVGIARDITERKRMEETLRKSEEQLRQFFEHLTIGVAVYEAFGDGENFIFVDMNPAGQRLSKVSIDAIRGKKITEIFPGVRELGLFKVLRDVWRTGETGYIPFQHYHDKRIQQWVENRVFRLPSGNVVAIYDDRTEHVRIEQELQRARKMESVGRLAGGVAHDFNNKLTVILGYTETILNQMAPDHPLHDNLIEIQIAAQHSADLVRQLLAFARQQAIAPKSLNLNVTVESRLNMLRRLIKEGIDLIWHPEGNLWSIHMDPSQIDQILTNLCLNARDAIADVGRIVIKTINISLDEFCTDHEGLVPGDYVVLAVSDDGHGMDKETIKNLFEPFFTTKDVGQGTGLGLATVYGIVKQNNGFINFDSEPGKGSTFRIYLPRHVETALKTGIPSPMEATTGGHETIMLVEDELSILKMAKEMLERLGYTTIAANDPMEAIRLAQAHAGQIHLLLTDVIMPKMNGQDLAKSLQMLYPEIKCLFMSGYTADVISHHGVLEEDIHFIQKPFSKTALAAKVREALGDTAPSE